jgi:release factor glutamine methyltransferase
MSLANGSWKIADALRAGVVRMHPRIESARLDAELLLATALGKPRSYLYAWPERVLSATERVRFEELLERRTQGEPLAYLGTRREFWSLDIVVTPDTLIPRPETEVLVALALSRIGRESRVRVADLGTGSGAIALAVAHERPNCQLVATDRCLRALAVARANTRHLGLTNIQLRQGDWCQALKGPPFAAILSNPPYVRSGDPHLYRAELRFEPRGALVGGSDGLEAIRRIAAQARHHLQVDGDLILEHGFDQGPATRALLSEHGYRTIETWNDGEGRERVTSAVWPGRADSGRARSTSPTIWEHSGH